MKRAAPTARRSRRDIVIAALGVLLLLDSVEALDLRFAYFAPAVAATAGAILARPRPEPVA